MCSCWRVFVATVASEFTRGTFRTMLLHQPARGRLLAGKVTVLVATGSAPRVRRGSRGSRPPRRPLPGDRHQPVADPRRSRSRLRRRRTDGALPRRHRRLRHNGRCARPFRSRSASVSPWCGPDPSRTSSATAGRQSEKWFRGLLLRAWCTRINAALRPSGHCITLSVYAVFAPRSRPSPSAGERHQLTGRRGWITPCAISAKRPTDRSSRPLLVPCVTPTADADSTSGGDLRWCDPQRRAAPGSIRRSPARHPDVQRMGNPSISPRMSRIDAEDEIMRGTHRERDLGGSPGVLAQQSTGDDQTARPRGRQPPVARLRCPVGALSPARRTPSPTQPR